MAVEAKHKSESTRLRVMAYGIILALFAVGMTAVYYHEELGHFIRLRGWDPAAPGRTVVGFLEAGRKGDQQGAARFMESDYFEPLVIDGKLVGYLLDQRGMRREYRFEDITPADTSKAASSEIVYDGGGYARVAVRNRKGALLYYRLEMHGGDWKIAYID